MEISQGRRAEGSEGDECCFGATIVTSGPRTGDYLLLLRSFGVHYLELRAVPRASHAITCTTIELYSQLPNIHKFVCVCVCVCARAHVCIFIYVPVEARGQLQVLFLRLLSTSLLETDLTLHGTL